MHDFDVTVHKVRHYKAGYEIRYETWDRGDGHPVEMRVAYTPKGAYIGTSKMAHFLCVKRGIAPEKAEPEDSVCSIGFCEKEAKWYGWSHRAICGFGIGDRIFEEDYGDDHTPFVSHGSVVIENLDQAKQAAIAFAEYVS